MFHAAMTGRRYEDFDALEPWKQMFENCQKQVAAVEPLLKKHQMKLAIENHKGWRAAEQVAWLKRLGSEWVGVCLDFGNNMALCEDPMDTARTLAPYVFFAHIKDMAVEEYEDGFLLSEVPMGEGILDLKQIVQLLRQKDPNMIFDLEMITRDPLKIPVYTPKYWATFDDTVSPLPGRDLAKVLALVKKNRPKKPLPKVTGLSARGRGQAGGRLQPAVHRLCPPEPGPVARRPRGHRGPALGRRGPAAAPECQRDGIDVLHRAARARPGSDGNCGPGRLRRGAPPRSPAVELSP